MPMHRMLPPAEGNRPTITVNGRTYSCPIGSFLDNVPDQDAFVMMANGWTEAASGGAGASTARPAKPQKGDRFFDTTLGYNIVFDGKTWRNPANGAAA